MQAELSPRQVRLLLIGESAGQAGRGFVTEAEELDAWTSHRDHLLKVSGAARPSAYFKHELREETPEWILDAERLFRGGLFNEKMIQQAEANCVTLAAAQPADLYSELESVDGIHALSPPLNDLEGLLREFGFAQAWHAFRGRPSLAEKYQRIGRAIRTVLREELQMLRVKTEQESEN